jgi:ubiquinone biosynthesis protein
VRISSLLKGPRRVRRMAHVAQKLASHGLGFMVGRMELRRHVPNWLRISRTPRPAQPEEMAKRFAAVLEELGPTFVKFGQMLATRPDVLPPDYILELERIYHHVAPFSAEAARRIVQEELGRPASEIFREFTDEPRASGSIAQVHEAVLHDGTPVVVKVRRPRIERVIEDDLAILSFLADQANRVEEFQVFRLPMLVEEFGRGIERELDFVVEAAYTHKFRQTFRDDARIEVPEVLWDYTTHRVLTMRRISGTHMNDVLRGQTPVWERRELARTIMDVYLRQLFVLGVFHGDPHPGNLLLTEHGRLAMLDFGLVGRVNARLRRDLSFCVIALSNGQIELVAEVLSNMGQTPAQRTMDEFREELADLVERYTGVPLNRLDFKRSFYDLMNLIRTYRVEVPRDFVLMGRTMVEISGMVTQLDPTLKLSSVARSHAQKLMEHKVTLEGLRKELTAGSFHMGALLTEGPREMRRFARQLQQGLFEFTIRHEGFERGLKELDQTGNRLAISVTLAAIIMASASLLTSQFAAIPLFGWRVSFLGLIGIVFGFLLGVWLIVGILRSRRL